MANQALRGIANAEQIHDFVVKVDRDARKNENDENPGRGGKKWKMRIREQARKSGPMKLRQVMSGLHG